MKMTKQEERQWIFIYRAKNKHGDQYDYSLVKYRDSRTPVKIICREHGLFLLQPKNLLDQGGCPKCTIEKRRCSLEGFIEKARKKHGDKYDYSQTVYVTAKTKVKIICPEHGPFTQTASDHYRGRGCPTCATLNRRLGAEEFIRRARGKHGDKYDYSKVEYTTEKTPVTIICPIHGEHQQTPVDHIKGTGCRECGAGTKAKNLVKGFDWFLPAAREVHGDKFTYVEKSYTRATDPVMIICPEHGPLEQSATAHVGGRGCQKCGHALTGEINSITHEEFLEKAIARHGDRYDYSQTIYTRSNQKVTIICREHGPFQQQANNHLMGQGCQKCGVEYVSGLRRKTTEQFIEEAREIFGDKYDYSQVEYSGAFDKITIICPEHGPFEATPDNHVNGKKHCRGCAIEALTRTTEQFIKEARAKHGDKYDYSLTEYINIASNVTIICREHGPFEQSANAHLQGRGCRRCYDESRRVTKEEFLQRTMEKHKGKYDYSAVVYEDFKTPVTIICPDHGPFQQQPRIHIKSGCKLCVWDGLRGDQEWFLRRARAAHGDKYDYSEAVYTGWDNLVIIGCPIHGKIEQSGGSHLNGAGCPGCAVSGFDSTKPGILYYLRIDHYGNVFYKIGITNRSVESRFNEIDLEKITILKTWYFENGADALKEETRILREYRGFNQNGSIWALSSGNHELFTKDVLELDTEGVPA